MDYNKKLAEIKAKKENKEQQLSGIAIGASNWACW
jgi:hypothetical protein